MENITYLLPELWLSLLYGPPWLLQTFFSKDELQDEQGDGSGWEAIDKEEVIEKLKRYKIEIEKI